MLNRIFQFANIPLTIANQAIFYSQNSTWSGEVRDYIQNTRKFSNNHRYMHQPTVLTFNGDLIFDGTRLPGHLEQLLRSMVGTPDTLICYALPNEYPPQFDMCKPCESCCDCEMFWLSAPAVLTSVNVDKNGDFYSGYKIELSFTLLDFFVSLDPFVWSYTGDFRQDTKEIEISVPDIIDIADNNTFPNCQTLFTDCPSCKFFARTNYVSNVNLPFIQFSTSVWSAIGNTANACKYPNAFSPSGTPILLLPAAEPYGKIYDVFVDSALWGAPPISYYAINFSDLASSTNVLTLTTSDVRVQIINEYTNANYKKTEETFLYLNDLKDQLIALGTNLRAGDEIYFGNINIYDKSTEEFYRPAFVYRATLNDGFQGMIAVHPRITYSGFAPGQIYPTRNKITVKYYGGWTSADYLNFQSIHWFRRI